MWQHLNDNDLMNLAERRALRGDPIPTDMAAEIERRGFILPTSN